jgi:hypothetical protein
MDKVREKWGKLTDDDLTVINGKKEQPTKKLGSALRGDYDLPRCPIAGVKWTCGRITVP